MRTIKELLIIVRDNLPTVIKKHSSIGGMCMAINTLVTDKKITLEESSLLQHYLHNNIPRNGRLRAKKYLHENSQFRGASGMSTIFILRSHWWVPRHIPPRIKWLNQQIKKQIE